MTQRKSRMMQRDGVFRFLTSFRDDRQGAVAIIVALLSVVLIGFAALAIDGGYLYWTRTQLQVAADAAALASLPRPAAADESRALSTLKYPDNKDGIHRAHTV